MSTVLKAGLVGLGSMGRHHARVLAGLEGVELVGVVDPMGDKNGWAQGAPVLSTVEELIALGIDYAVVACPTALHEEVGLQLADAGVSALIEKPLADTVEGARRLVEAFESRGLVVEASATSSAATRPSSRSAPAWRPASWAMSTRSSPVARAPSRTGSPTSAWSRTWPPTTSI